MREISVGRAWLIAGAHGWKLRPASDGRPETKSFSPEEVNFARTEFVIDGPLIDYKAKGVTADLDGIDTVDGRKAYRLSLKLPTGAERNPKLDKGTFAPPSVPLRHGGHVRVPSP